MSATLDKLSLTLDRREIDALHLLAAAYLDRLTTPAGRQALTMIPGTSGQLMDDAERLALFIGRIGKAVRA